MRKCSADVNHIRLHGAVGEAPVYSHLNHGVEFYTFPLVVRRLSGAEDQVNVVAPLELLECCGPLERESELTVLGEVRTFNNRTGVGSRLVISAFARELRQEPGEDENRLELSGTLCKTPSLRATPLGRTICDMILAVNRRYGRADYLPCIAWGAIAQQTARLPVGSRLTVEGRVQSRGYTKTVDGVGQERTAYEVSIMRPAEPEEFLL